MRSSFASITSVTTAENTVQGMQMWVSTTDQYMWSDRLAEVAFIAHPKTHVRIKPDTPSSPETQAKATIQVVIADGGIFGSSKEFEVARLPQVHYKELVVEFYQDLEEIGCRAEEEAKRRIEQEKARAARTIHPAQQGSTGRIRHEIKQQALLEARNVLAFYMTKTDRIPEYIAENNSVPGYRDEHDGESHKTAQRRPSSPDPEEQNWVEWCGL
ncbi:hypothetical protein DENSPDRAFT_283870 [Dentipellis sp. KUC8613]|nr:hypothetical protein DENSPDRAFT_283870 [Dentipellis sp. KUC8613]